MSDQPQDLTPTENDPHQLPVDYTNHVAVGDPDVVIAHQRPELDAQGA